MADHNAVALGRLIKGLREQRGLSQEKLALYADLPWPTTIAKLENGTRRLGFTEAVQLSRALTVSLDDFAAALDLPAICRTCGNTPPPGFTCNDCGREA